MHSPTKADEIAALKKLGESLGPNSYLGPWIKEYLPAIQSDIQNDFPVSAPMPSVARNEAIDIIVNAKKEAEIITQRAFKQCADARTDCEGRLRRSIEQASAFLGHAADEVRRMAVS